MNRAWLLTALTIAATGLAACGEVNSGEVRTVTVTGAESQAREAPTSAPLSGAPTLIETRVTDARQHTGEVVDGSVIGETPFCPGGTTTGGSEGATITTTFRCSDGTLKLRYAPTQRSRVQGSTWEVVSGTGEFEDLRGGGSMVAPFEAGDPDAGREVFTGTLGDG